MKNNYDIAIVGAGVIGAAIGDLLAQAGYQVVIIEKNATPGKETTEGNSGIIHGGFDPTPGKLNAELNLSGRKLYETKWFKELDFPWKQADSLVIAFTDEEVVEIEKLYARGIENGLLPSEIQIVDKATILAKEPSINPAVKSGLLCTVSYIVDPVLLTQSLLNRFKSNKGTILLSHQVNKITKGKNNYQISCQNNDQTYHLTATTIVNAAGHYSDEIAKLAGVLDFSLHARRGQYCILTADHQPPYNQHVIFLVPTTYGKGVLVAPMMDNHILVGPTAEENIAKTDTRLVNFEQIPLITNFGHKIMPKLNFQRITKIFSGSRPISNTNDFIIETVNEQPQFINVAGIKSPGLSAAPAIAEKVVTMITNKKNMKVK